MLCQGFFTFQPGALLSLKALVIGYFSCTNINVMPPPFPSQHSLSSIGIQEVWAGQDFCFWTSVLGAQGRKSMLSFLKEKSVSVFYRARRYMREDSKTGMLCGVCLFHSLEILWDRAIFQEWGKNTALWTGTSILKLLHCCPLAPSVCQQSYLPSPLQFWIVNVAQKFQGIALCFFFFLFTCLMYITCLRVLRVLSARTCGWSRGQWLTSKAVHRWHVTAYHRNEDSWSLCT